MCVHGSDNDKGEVRVFPGKVEVTTSYCTVPVDNETNMMDLCRQALERFALDKANTDDYRVSQLVLERGGE